RGLALDGSNKMAPAPAAASPAEQASTETSAPNPAVTETAATTEPTAATTEPAGTKRCAGEAEEEGPPPPPATTTQLTVTAQQAAPPDPMASLDPADRPVAEKIRDFFAGTSDRIFANKKERAAAEAFYQSRSYAPLWLDRGVANARATSAIARLKNADADGLEVGDYKMPNFAGLGSDALAEADLKLTQTVLTYAPHVQAGGAPYTRVSGNL